MALSCLAVFLGYVVPDSWEGMTDVSTHKSFCGETTCLESTVLPKGCRCFQCMATEYFTNLPMFLFLNYLKSDM